MLGCSGHAPKVEVVKVQLLSNNTCLLPVDAGYDPCGVNTMTVLPTVVTKSMNPDTVLVTYR